MARFVVAVVADAKIMPSAVFTVARLCALNPRADTEIVLLSDSAPDLKAARDLGVSASMKLADFSGLPQAGRFPGASFFRFFLPDVLPEDVERILYVDTDISVEDGSRLFRLFDLDMGGNAIAAVRDYTVAFEGHTSFREESARAGARRKYLNSGVLLIDRREYLTRRLAQRFIQAARTTTRLPDQSVINTVLQGDWLELSPAMNMMLPLWNSFARAAFPPALVHFVGDVKPWHALYGEDHPIRQQMQRYLASSPWPKFMQHQNFAQLWNAQHNVPTREAPPRKFAFSPFADLEGVAELLRTEPFADVLQGVSERREWEIPARGAVAQRPLVSGGLRAP